MTTETASEDDNFGTAASNKVSRPFPSSVHCRSIPQIFTCHYRDMAVVCIWVLKVSALPFILSGYHFCFGSRSTEPRAVRPVHGPLRHPAGRPTGFSPRVEDRRLQHPQDPERDPPNPVLPPAGLPGFHLP